MRRVCNLAGSLYTVDDFWVAGTYLEKFNYEEAADEPHMSTQGV